MKKQSTPITRVQMIRDGNACRKVEGAIWSGLRDAGVGEKTAASRVCAVLAVLACPPWCDTEAWQYMLNSFAGWARAHGSLEVHAALTRLPKNAVHPWLKRRRGERVEADVELVLEEDEEES